MGRTFALAGAIGLIGLAGASSAGAQGALDANCPGPGEDLVVINTGDRYAQTFTALSSGGLTRGEIAITEGPLQTGSWLMRVLATASGSPTDTVLASAVIPDVPAGTLAIAGQFAVPAQVVAGTQYALAISRGGTMQLEQHSDDPCGGGTFFQPGSSGPWTMLGPEDLVFAVFVEPPAPETGPGDVNAPNATLTKVPKDKTKKKSATFEFTGTDTRAVAGFQCSLDGAVFAPCTSPHTVKVKKGKHTFSVRAIDQAGNIGAPATDAWKVKRKKKKK